MAKFGFGRKFHELNNFEFFFQTFKLLYTPSYHHHFIVVLSYLNITLTITCSIPPLAHSLALSSKTCRLFKRYICQHKLLGFVDQCVVTC